MRQIAPCPFGVLMVLLGSEAVLAAPTHDWSRSFAFYASPHVASIQTDIDGNLLVTGDFDGSFLLGDTRLVSGGVSDVLVAKFDPQGMPLWSRSVGGWDYDFGTGVATDGAGNVFVTGRFRSELDFGGGLLSSEGNEDVFLAKLDPDGNHIWSRRFGDSRAQEPTSIAVDAMGNVAVTGSFDGQVDFGGGPLSAGTFIDGFVVVFDSDGNHLWSRSFGDDSVQTSGGVVFDATGNVLIAGDFSGAVDFGGGQFSSAGAFDIFLAKFDGGGQLLWAQQFGDASTQRVEGLAIDGEGKLILTGYFYGSVDFGGAVFESVADADGYLASFDADGNHLWSRQFGGELDQIPTSVAVDGSDRVLLTGFYEETVDFGGGPLTSEGPHEQFVAAYESSGDHRFSRDFAAVEYTFGSCIGPDGSDNVVFSGGFTATVDLGGGPFTAGLASDGFLAKLDNGGQHLWSRRLGQPSGLGSAAGVVVDASNHLVLTGSVAGSADFGSGAIGAGFNDDIIVAKFDPGGQPLWDRRFGDTNSQYYVIATTDGSQNILLTGSFESSMDFGGGALAALGRDLYLAKLDGDGNHLWSHRFGDAASQVATDVATATSGDVVITGHFTGSVDFGGGALTATGSAQDIFVAAFDAAGNHRWSKRFGDASDQQGLAVAVDAAGNVIVTGSMMGNVDFGGGTFMGAGGNDIFLASFDADGSYRWSRRFGDSQSQAALSIDVDGAGNVNIAGTIQGNVDFGGGELSSAGGNDIFLASFTNTASHRWSKRFGSPFVEYPVSVDVDEVGHVLLTSTIYNGVDFGGGPLVGGGGMSIALARFDAAGDHSWSRRYDGHYELWPAAGVFDASGDIALAASSRSFVDFGDGRLAGTILLAHFGDEQVPMRFASFEATLRLHAVQLRWDVRSDDIEEEYTLYRRDTPQAPAVVIASGNLRATDPSYLDASVSPGKTYHYQLVIHTRAGEDLESSLLSISVPAPRATLAQNSPNPFNPKTIIEYTLAERSMPMLQIYDAAGKRVAGIEQGVREAGVHRIEWDGKDSSGHALASGVYYYSLAGVRGLPTKKMLLLR